MDGKRGFESGPPGPAPQQGLPGWAWAWVWRAFMNTEYLRTE